MVYCIRLLYFSLICTIIVFVSVGHADNIEIKKNNKIEKLIFNNNFSELKLTGSKYVKNIINPYSINMEDGTIVELTAIYYPDGNGNDYDVGKYYLQGMGFLEKELAKEKVSLYQTKDKTRGRKNRMGHQRAHIVRNKDKLWIQGELIRQGFAYAKVNIYNPEMVNNLYEIEEYARANKTGLWGDDRYKILSHNEVSDKISSFRIVEGIVKKVSIVKNNVYLNFGNDWKTDFTIMIDSNMRKIFGMNGINLTSLTNKKVRVRGFIEEYYGPMIKIKQTEQLEIFDDKKNKKWHVISSSKFKGFGHIKVRNKKEDKEDKNNPDEEKKSEE